MMAMTPEAVSKRKDQALLIQIRERITSTQLQRWDYGRGGVPDIVGCHPESKLALRSSARPGTNKPTALQVKDLSDIGVAGGIGPVWLTKHNMMDIENILKV